MKNILITQKVGYINKEFRHMMILSDWLTSNPFPVVITFGISR